jgi:hypothetical protein
MSEGWPWPNPMQCSCGVRVKSIKCPRCAASEAYRIADLAQRGGELMARCVNEEVDPHAYEAACADRDVALALLSQERRTTAALKAQVVELQKETEAIKRELRKRGRVEPKSRKEK